ncbi:MAG TPA: response regulator [Thermoanaerobaculia bacterium]
MTSASRPGSRRRPQGLAGGSAGRVSPGRVALLYAAFGALWVLLSDLWVFRDADADGRLLLVQNSKGLLFVACSALLVYLLLRYELRRRRGSEQALEASQETLAKIFDGLDDATFIVEPATRTILDCNPAAERMFGYTREELVGKNTRILHRDEESYVEFDRRRRTDVMEGGVARTEFVVRRKTGEILDTEHTVILLGEGGDRALSIVRDISDRRRSEALLLHAQKMEAVGRLAGGVAHDFNNLLTAILGYCELAAARCRRGETAETEIAEIRRAAERAGQLTAQLLAFSRQQMREPRYLDPNQVLAELAGMLRVVAGEDVALELDLTPEPLRVMIDPGQLEQVVVNLAVNARDAMPRGGRLAVETRWVTLAEPLPAADREIPPGEFAVLAVADDGEGILPENRERIFEPFFTTKPVGKGTGLGLSTVYGIVTQNDGFVRVESEPDRGSRFEVYLPLAPAEAELGPSASDEGAGLPDGSETILVVEDEALVRELVVAVLRDQGYDVFEAADGAAALRRVEEGPVPDLLVTDVVLPVMDGRTLAARIGERLPGLPVLFMSGYGEAVISRHGILDDGIELLQKPFAPMELVSRVRELLDGRD